MAPRFDTSVYRQEFEADIRAQIEAVGRENIRPAEVFRRWGPRGLPRSTCFRWCSELLGPMPERHDARRAAAAEAQPPEAAAGAGAPPPPPPPGTPIALPAPPGGGGNGRGGGNGAAGPGVVSASLSALMERALADLEVIRRMAFAADGKTLRNARLLLLSIEGLRKQIETGLRVAERAVSIERLEAMLAEIMGQIGEEDPATAQRVVKRLEQLALRWGA